MRTPGKPLALTLVFSILLIGTLLATSSRPARADSGDLPPRPTTVAVVNSPVGGYIRLHVAFPESWDWSTHPWQMTLTQVQWQTGEGDWVNVNGWYGALDAVDINADGSVTGTKLWWVAPRDYGTGPFRWLATAGDDGVPLAASEPFTLPARSAVTTNVAVHFPK